MKMNFLQQNNPRSFQFRSPKRSKFSRNFLFLILLVSILILINRFTFGSFSSALHRIGEPIWRAQAQALQAFENVGLWFTSKEALNEENKRLRAEIGNLRLSGITSEALRHENETLRSVLNREKKEERIVASVLARPSRTLYDTFVIDIGRREGVAKDARVFGPADVVIGTVAQVYPRTSLVSLYSTPGRVTEVFIGADPVSAEALGRGGGDFEVRIPRGIETNKGMPVVSPALDGGILGIIEEIVSLPADSFQTIYVGGPINMQSLRFVSVELTL